MAHGGGWVRDPSVLGHEYDVIVVGAGITGIQVARELAGRGGRVLLLDKDDIGCGTSSATTKYIHGGLRYLEQGDVRTVAESVRERRLLAIASPHLVVPRRFLIPIWKWTRPGRVPLAAGLGLYELIAANKNSGVAPQSRSGRVAWYSAERAQARAPWLRQEGLIGAFSYFDMLNEHPERLLVSIVRSAVDLGATVLTHARVSGIRLEPGPIGDRVVGVEVVDEVTGTTHQVRSSYVVNAAGPWADKALGDLGNRVGLRVKRAKGVHLLTRPLGGQDAVFTRTRDGAHVVISPWQGMSVIGPTDTWTDESADAVTLTEADIDILATAVADISDRPLEEEDLLGFTVGVRPLVEDGQEGSYNSSRRFHLHDHRRSGVVGLLSITGGKWTTGRAIGAAVADAVVAAGAVPHAGPFDSRRVALHGTLPDDDRGRLIEDLVTEGPLDRRTIEYLVRLYGIDSARIVELVRLDPALGQPLSGDPTRRDIAAQVVFAVTDESALTLRDVLDRRLVLGTLGRVSRQEVEATAAVLGGVRGWSMERVVAEASAESDRRAAFDEVAHRWGARSAALND